MDITKKIRSIFVSGAMLGAIAFECPESLADGTACRQPARTQQESAGVPQLYHCECPLGHTFHLSFDRERPLTPAAAAQLCGCGGE